MEKGIITSVTSKEGYLPKDLYRWNRQITYDENMMRIDAPALLFYIDEEGKEMMTRTSTVEAFGEDKNNLVIYTRNSIYNIKKII